MDNFTVWNINGLELELDISEADTAERYQSVIEGLEKDVPVTKISGITAAAFIRAYCKAHRNMYDKLFGEGTSEKLFAEIPDSIRKYNAVYAKLLAFVGMQTTTLHDEVDEVKAKYLPKDKGKAKK